MKKLLVARRKPKPILDEDKDEAVIFSGRTKRTLVRAALIFFIASLLYHDATVAALQLQLQLQFPQQNQGQESRDSRSKDAPPPTTTTTKLLSPMEYIRPKGGQDELLEIFESLSSSVPSSMYLYEKQLQLQSSPQLLPQLPTTPEQIAKKYGIPKTATNVICNTGSNATTTIGWIPSSSSSSYKDHNNNTISSSSSGRIPRLIFQSWKTNHLREEICNLVLTWSRMNPEYDYFLFDDTSVNTFIQLEYGKEIYSAYSCVNVGAAKCDVWRLMVIYLFGGIYFDLDTQLKEGFAEWGFGNRSVVASRSCTAAPRKHPGGCAPQWGLIYAPQHPVIYTAIRETLTNLANRNAAHVYDIAFWSYYRAWRNGPYNQSYVPGWADSMGRRVEFSADDAKGAMTEENGHWSKTKQIWHPDCLKEEKQ